MNRNQGAESTLAFLWTEMRGGGNHHAATVTIPRAPRALGKRRIRTKPLTQGRSIDSKLNNCEPYTELFRRHDANPILTAQDWPYPAHTVFNAGACQIGDETILLVRVEDRRGHSHLTVARSNDGVSNWRINPTPSFAPDAETLFGRSMGRGRSRA